MIGFSESIFLLALGVLFFSWRRFPELGRAIGDGIRGFRDSLSGKRPMRDLHGGQSGEGDAS